MDKLDYNKIAKFEKAIKEKYGPEAIVNPKKFWDEDKEKKYLQELERFYKKRNKNKKKETTKGDFLLLEKKVTTQLKRNCPVCDAYSISTEDDVYMSKFECCHNCYIQYVEGREERWKTGWRPNN